MSFKAYSNNDTIKAHNFDQQMRLMESNIQSLQGENYKLHSKVNTLTKDLENSNLVMDSIKFELSKVLGLIRQTKKIKSDILILYKKTGKSNVQLDSLKTELTGTKNAVNQKADSLGIKISDNQASANKRIDKVDHSLSKNSLYGIIGVLLAFIVSGLVYWFLSKRQKTDKTDLIEKLGKTKSSIEESLVKEFSKHTELLETQVKLFEAQLSSIQAEKEPEEIDHSLALKVADEITLIERNISLMDHNIKGLKQLNRSIQRLRDNLSANGYEMPVLLGEKFDDGLNLQVINVLPDENLEKDVEIITRIIKPQVNFRDKMIQTAQIETTKGI